MNIIRPVVPRLGANSIRSFRPAASKFSRNIFRQQPEFAMATIATANKPYLLTLDAEASKRLNLQNDIFLRMFKGKFLPESVIARLKEVQASNGNVKIAELATGTGIWLYTIRSQLAESSIDAEMHGYDLFDNQFPPAEARQGVIFDVADILDTAKYESIGPVFDYVHVRLLAFVLTADDWPTAIENAFKLLKPGGILHFVDIPMQETSIERNGTIVAAGMLKKMKGTLSFTKKDMDCASTILRVFNELNLKNITNTRLDLRDFDDETRTMQNVNALMGKEEFIKAAVSRGSKALNSLGYESEEAALAELKEAEKDYTERGARAVFVLHSILGVKP
ncbi:hypothetical protein ABW19_dt0207085 [Dactylella cylindrospora]|nr:hypothetical protein ABW19_dt0207085 [Dactylella cylindrospora]